MLATITYRWSKNLSELVTRNKLVIINSSKHADANTDTSAAVQAMKAWFNSDLANRGATYESITAEETIDAENPEPAALYTEADLVSFGNFMASKVCNLQPDQSPVVFDSDLANWREIKNQ